MKQNCTYLILPLAIPHIIPFSFGEESINEGDTMAVNCMISKGDLPLQIEWQHNGLLIPRQSITSGINILDMSARLSTLNFEYIRGEHRGNYTCVATNPAGRVESTAELNINGYFLPIKIIITLVFLLNLF